MVLFSRAVGVKKNFLMIKTKPMKTIAERRMMIMVPLVPTKADELL